MPDELKVTICAGLPGLPGYAVDSGKYPYSDITPNFAKLMREHGIAVNYEHDREMRQYVSLNAADIWIPIVQVAYEALLMLDGHLLADLIIDTLGIDRAKKSQLHVEYRIIDKEGNDQSLKIHGNGDDVLAAVKLFEGKMLE